MRIVLVNWARIWDGAASGGGVNGYCQALALELVRRGHDVVSLCGGTAHHPLGSSSPDPARWPCTVRRHPDWLGIRVFEVINSPVLAPSMAQFNDPTGEVSSPALEREVGAFFQALGPDVVHFHNIEGFSIGCVEAARQCRSPAPRVVYSLHNYHTICPQVYLLQGHRIPCHDSRGGVACAGCIQVPAPAATRSRRAEPLVRSMPRPAEADPAPVFKGLWGVTRTRARASAVPPLADPPGQPVTVATIATPLPGPARENRGVARRLAPLPADARELRPLTNDIAPDTTPPANDYGRRRAAMVGMLGSCDSVLAVSEFVRRKFESMGVPPRVLRTMHIGSRIGELVAAHPPVAPRPFDPPRPIRAVFLGSNNYAKGLPMLADALDLTPPEALARFHLSIYALGARSIWPRFRRLEPRLAGLTFREGYDFEDIPWLLSGADLGLVASVWWDNAPQTVFEFQACSVPVLAPALGGIPDFIENGVNGLLFRGNDRADLASHLARIAADPSLLTRLRRNAHPPWSMPDHAAELERVYAGPVS